MTTNAFGEPLTAFKHSAADPVEAPAAAKKAIVDLPPLRPASKRATAPVLRAGVSKRLTLNLRARDQASMDFLVAVLRGAFEGPQ